MLHMLLLWVIVFKLMEFEMYGMAFPVVEFSREGYKIRKVFG